MRGRFFQCLVNKVLQPRKRPVLQSATAYSSALSVGVWDAIRALFAESLVGLHASLCRVLNAIFFVFRTGCQWRQLPHDLPPGSTVKCSFSLHWRAGWACVG